MISENSGIITWLLQGDAAVRWQVLKDLLDSKDYPVEQAKVASEGWGLALLQKQDADGYWAGGVYTPKWTSTTYTLLLLRQLGLPAENEQAQKGCRLLLDNGFRPNGGISFWRNWPMGETCVSAMVFGILSYFRYSDSRLETMLDYFAEQQMPDGGWNCQYPRRATHASFHTTLLVLNAIDEYSRFQPNSLTKIMSMREKAHEFLLLHRLCKSHRSGKVVSENMTRFSFPPHWHYHVHLALDYFQRIDHPYDSRFEDGIALLNRKEKNGLWPLQQRHAGRMWFELEQVGQPSRVNTMIAMRILKWWDKVHPRFG